MSLEERRERHRALMALVEKNDIAAWCQSFLAALSRASSADDPANWLQPEPIRDALENFERAGARRPASKRCGRGDVYDDAAPTPDRGNCRSSDREAMLESFSIIYASSIGNRRV